MSPIPLAFARAPVLLLLVAIVTGLVFFAAGDRTHASSAPNPCTLLTEEEAVTALEAPLDGEPFFMPFGDLGACSWSDVDGDDMELFWFTGSEEDAEFFYENTATLFEEEISGLGDRAKWVSLIALEDFIWFELRVLIGNHYLSLDIEKRDPEPPFFLDNTQKMLETMAIILTRLEPRPAVEFTQAIQELQTHHQLASYIAANGEPPVPIVEGKPAVARVYFDDINEAGQRTVELSGVVSDSVTVPVSPSCTVEMQRKLEGGCMSADLYFTPPVGEWTAEFTIKNEDGEQIDEFDFTIKSLDTQSFGVTYLPVCVALTAGAVPTCPSLYVEHDVSDLILKNFPVAADEFFYSRMPSPAINLDAPVSNSTQRSELLAELRLRWELLAIGSSPSAFSGDQLAAWLPQGGSPGLAGLSDPLWLGRSGRVSFQKDGSATIPLDTQHTLAHEIGHNLGLRHTNLPDGCGAVDSNTDWPYMDSTIQEVGFDVEEKEVKPKAKKDLMSYCSTPEGNNWISPFTYKKLAEGNFQPQRSGAIPSGDPGQFLLVKGSVQGDGSAGSIDSAFVIDSTIPSAPSNPLGEHCLHLTGGPQMDYCFNLTFVEHRSGAPLEEESFVIRVPLPPGTDEAFLMRNGFDLDSLELSASAPEVEITSPQPGSEWSGEQTIEWTASDADGGPLSIAVLYSPDGGANWLPIEVTIGETEFTFNTRDLTGDNIMLRVLASDGLNTTEDTVSGIMLSNGDERIWGDNDCDGDTDAVDGLKTLQDLASLPYSQSEPCPDLGGTVDVTPAGATAERLWGDVDCDGDLDAADGLSILRSLAGLPVNQQQPCPPIGSPVLVR